jgi:hypothetical protein
MTVLEGGCTCQSVQTKGSSRAPLGLALSLMVFGLMAARARRRR